MVRGGKKILNYLLILTFLISLCGCAAENTASGTDNDKKIIEELNEICECSNHSKAKILLDDFIQGFVCEKCIKTESQSNPQYIFSNYVAYFETKGF